MDSIENKSDEYVGPLRVTFCAFCDNIGDTSGLDANRIYYKYPYAYQRFINPNSLGSKQIREDIANCVCLAIKSVLKYSSSIRIMVSPTDIAVYTYRDAYPYLRVIDCNGPTYTNSNGEKRSVVLPDMRLGISYLNKYLSAQLKRIHEYCVEKELIYTLDLYNYDTTSRKHG